jgi:acetyl-CoA C-acetyltransferase
VLADADLAADEVDEVVLGNALYGGGNPARLAALAAGIPDHVPAVTLDSQCCAGLDAVLHAALLVRAGEARVVLAGGIESYSRAPLRLRRPKAPGEEPQPYARPPFTPWPARDPDMIEAAAALAQARGTSRESQARFAIESHRKALASPKDSSEIVPLAGVAADAFPRRLAEKLCSRLPLLAGDDAHGVTAATVAVEADAAAMVLVAAADVASGLGAAKPVAIRDGARGGHDPAWPGLAPVRPAKELLRRRGLAPEELACAEVMEAFAVQALACIEEIGLPFELVNRGGGALARGHPIGASGAVLAVRLWHELQAEKPGAAGLAAIAAAGGLGSALLLVRP